MPPVASNVVASCHGVPRAIEVDRLVDLAPIYEPDVNLCVLPRRADPAVAGSARACLERPVAVSAVVPAGSLDWGGVLRELADIDGFGAFVADVARIAEIYVTLLAPHGR